MNRYKCKKYKSPTEDYYKYHYLQKYRMKMQAEVLSIFTFRMHLEVNDMASECILNANVLSE